MADEEIIDVEPSINEDTKKIASKLLDRLSSLEEQRESWEDHWQDVADYIVPRKADFTRTRSAGDKRMDKIYDGTAIHASELLSASIHGMLTSASTNWFNLCYMNFQLTLIDEAKEWLEEVEAIMYAHFHRSNFQEQIHELYHDLITFGTGVIYVESNPETGFRFETRHISECFLAEDSEGRVDTVYRKYKMSVRSAQKLFGEEASSRINKLMKSNPHEEIEIVHVVMPRDERDIEKLSSENKPFASIYIDPEEKVIIKESGFDEFPYMCPRYLKASFERGYGRSPAMQALPDVKMLNKMSEVTIRSAEKQVDPPLMLPDDGFMLPIRTVPGGLNFYRSGTRDRLEPLQTGSNNPLGLQMEDQRRQAIRSAFYVDQLVMGAGPQMTATEVVARTEEKMRLLGPVLGRLQAELLQPLINRSYNILLRQEQLPPPPQVISGQDIEIEYVSPLAKAQRQTDVQSTMQMLQVVQPVAQIDPTIIDHLDGDGLIKHLLKSLSIPASVIRSEDEIQARRNKKQEEQQQQGQMQEQMQQAEIAKNSAPMVEAFNQMDTEEV